MIGEFQDDSLLVRYILGKASPEECRELEAEYPGNAELFEEMVAAENDLIDAYVGGQLSGTDRVRFEKHFLVTSERRQRVEFAEALLDQIAAEDAGIEKKTKGLRAFLPAALNRWPTRMQFGLAALLLAMVAWSSWVTTQNTHLRREIDKLRTSAAELQGKERELQQQLEALSRKDKPGREHDEQEQVATTHPAGPSSLAVLILHAEIPRSSGTQNILVLSSGTRLVRLRMEMEERENLSFGASLENANGGIILQRENLTVRVKQHGTTVDLPLPAKILKIGDYVVNLTATLPTGTTETVNSYTLHVTKR